MKLEEPASISWSVDDVSIVLLCLKGERDLARAAYRGQKTVTRVIAQIQNLLEYFFLLREEARMTKGLRNYRRPTVRLVVEMPEEKLR